MDSEDAMLSTMVIFLEEALRLDARRHEQTVRNDMDWVSSKPNY